MTQGAGGAQAHFEAELKQGRFLIQYCRACSRHVFYPRQGCLHCGAADTLEWAAPGGGGTVYSITTVHIGLPQPTDVSLIDLDEGVRMMSIVRNVAAGQLRIGQRVRALVAAAAGSEPARVMFDIDEADADAVGTNAAATAGAAAATPSSGAGTAP